MNTSTQNSRRTSSHHAPYREMIFAGILWIAFAAMCVFAANAMATAL